VKQFARWLAHGFTGCGFAQSFANSKSRVFLVATDGVTAPEQVDVLFDTAAAESQPAFLVFPAIRDESALVAQLQRLRSGQRWTVKSETVKGLTTSDLLVGLRWTTRDGMTSMPMGFGPFPTMPVTRRAPYVCIATWPGGHENPFSHRRKPMAGAVDFLDSALPQELSKDEFDVLWDVSVGRTRDLLEETHDNPRHYRTVAFRLSAQAASAF
jgi:hypothetical protein